MAYDHNEKAVFKCIEEVAYILDKPYLQLKSKTFKKTYDND